MPARILPSPNTLQSGIQTLSLRVGGLHTSLDIFQILDSVYAFGLEYRQGGFDNERELDVVLTYNASGLLKGRRPIRRAMYRRVCGTINLTTLWAAATAWERPSSASRNPFAVPKCWESTVCCWWASDPSKMRQVSSAFLGQENVEDAVTFWKTRSIECQGMAFDTVLAVLFT
ncbi:hypothetical protein BDV32DRAFT_155830 [Aspergillus pseudonomiae]|nr:hypothetical protein BDV32DRAFT_155830 [Aspergillus pseudonomiae]